MDNREAYRRTLDKLEEAERLIESLKMKNPTQYKLTALKNWEETAAYYRLVLKALSVTAKVEMVYESYRESGV